jgi:hypothetical protein
MKPFLLRSAFLVAFCVCMTVARTEEGTFQLKQTISLPGVEGRIDHFALDASGEDGARNGIFLSELDVLFVAVPHRSSQQAEVRCYQIE